MQRHDAVDGGRVGAGQQPEVQDTGIADENVDLGLPLAAPLIYLLRGVGLRKVGIERFGLHAAFAPQPLGHDAVLAVTIAYDNYVMPRLGQLMRILCAYARRGARHKCVFHHVPFSSMSISCCNPGLSRPETKRAALGGRPRIA